MKIRTSLFLTIALFAIIMGVFAQPKTKCAAYLMKLSALMTVNFPKFQDQMAPYLLFSGKAIDDLGYSGSCERDQNNYMYSIAEISFVEENEKFFGYMGFCFVEYCSADELTMGAGFIIDYILDDYHTKIKSNFVDPDLDTEFSVVAFLACMFFTLPIAIGMLAPMKRWVKLCLRSQSEQYIIKSTYIDLQNPNTELEEEKIDKYSPVIERLSFAHKINYMFKPESSDFIYWFSFIRIIVVPFMINGELFAQSNKAAFNYISFADSVYGTLFAKIALFAYYLPDLLFMISAYLFAKKLHSYRDVEHSTPIKYIFHCFFRKLLRLYPIYIAILLIYWLISPALHCGPVWYAYQNEVAACDQSWWRAVLLIDNWFSTNACYPASWFVQVEIQYSIVAVILYTCYYYCKPAFRIVLALIFTASFVLLFLISGQIIVSYDSMLHPRTSTYFRSFQSHLPFYLAGIFLVILMKSEKQVFVREHFVKNKLVVAILSIVSLTITGLVFFRPSVWSQSQHSLQAELAVSRTGLILVYFYICILCIATKGKKKQTCIHKYAYYVYPTLLISQLVIQGAYWSVGSFMYIGSATMLDAALSNVLVSAGVGLLVGMICDFKV